MEDVLEEGSAVLHLGELEVCCPFVGGESEQDDPVSAMLEEGEDAIAPHVGGYGESIYLEMLKEATSIHITRIAYIPPLGVGDDELIGVVCPQILHRLLEGENTEGAHTLVES